jgi:hypothetical protein
MGEIFGKVQRAVEQHLKAGRRVAEMDPHDAVVDLAPVAVVLPDGAFHLARPATGAEAVAAVDKLQALATGAGR